MLTHQSADSLNVIWPRQSQLLYTGPDKIIQGLYAELIPLGSISAGLILAFICPLIGHERWQMVALMTVETALIGSLASLGVNSRIQAIATVPFLSISISLPQLLAFAMISLGLGEEFKDDMCVSPIFPSYEGEDDADTNAAAALSA
jgi:hypothetical protein